MSVKRECKTCGKEFTTYPSKIKAGRGKYCSRECCKHNLIQKGQNLSPETQYKKGHTPWHAKGWRYTQSRPNGSRYKEIHKPDHPNCTKAGYVREHRLVMEEHLGRLLKPNEVVHHKNHNTLDNHIDNLEVMDKVDHDRLHVKDTIHKRWYENK